MISRYALKGAKRGKPIRVGMIVRGLMGQGLTNQIVPQGPFPVCAWPLCPTASRESVPTSSDTGS